MRIRRWLRIVVVVVVVERHSEESASRTSGRPTCAGL